MVAFNVAGTPAPQGSKTALGRGGRVLEGRTAGQRARHKAWRSAVAWRGRAAMRSRPPLDGPLSVTIRFRIAMPKSRPAAVRHAGIGPHTVSPDIDKLVRSTLDALKDGEVITDDARVSALPSVDAVEVLGWTGAEITVEPHSVDLEAEVRRAAAEVYRPDGVELWMHARNRALDGARPADLVASGQTARVFALLEALADGVVS